MDIQRQRAHSVGGLAMASMLAAATAAQVPDKPDFSGTWVLTDPAAARPDVPRTLTVTQSVRRENVRGKPMTPFFDSLTVVREFPTDVRTDSYRIGIEGGTSSAPGGPTCKTTFGVRWDENRLVIENGSYSRCTGGGPYTEHTEIWQLDAAGMLILSVTDRGSDFGTRRNTLTYRRN
jgi:hypothetical protein